MADVSAIGKNKIITVRSQDRSFGTASNFGISLNQYNLNPKYVCWHQISIPNGFFNVNALDTSISYSITNNISQTYTIVSTIPAGNYTTSTLLTALAVMNADATTYASAPSNFFTFTYNNNNGYFTISTATSGWTFSINTTPGALEWILGYRPGQASLTNVTSSTGGAILDLRSVPCIYIRSSLVAGNYLSARGSDSILAVVQNTSLFSQTIFQRSPHADIDLFPVSGHLSQVNFQLVDEWGRELTMDTHQDWEISVSLYQ